MVRIHGDRDFTFQAGESVGERRDSELHAGKGQYWTANIGELWENKFIHFQDSSEFIATVVRVRSALSLHYIEISVY